MSGVFWACVALGYAAGGWTSYALARFAAGRVSDDSLRPAHVRRAGVTAGAVASLPALFFATVLGGTLGGTLGDGIGARFALGSVARQILTGAGVGLGVFCVLVVTIVGTAIAGAVFMKVYLAR